VSVAQEALPVVQGAVVVELHILDWKVLEEQTVAVAVADNYPSSVPMEKDGVDDCRCVVAARYANCLFLVAVNWHCCWRGHGSN